MTEPSTIDSSNDWPELQACSSVRASIIRQLLRDRNILQKKLGSLACSELAKTQLMEWLDGVVHDLPNPARLAEALFVPGRDAARFEATWETLESTHGVLGRMPRPASGYLNAIAGEDNAEELALFYWSHLHHPLRDQLDLLRYAVTDLVLSDPLTRRVQDALRRQGRTGDDDAFGEGERPGEARAAIPAGLEGAEHDEKRALGSLTRTADPIARLLSDVRIQPIGLHESSGLLAHRRVQTRRQATRTYAIHFVQKHLRLPTGRHAISRHGQLGDDFWLDFGQPGDGGGLADNDPSSA